MSWIHIKNHVHNRISKIVHNFEQNYQTHVHTPTNPPAHGPQTHPHNSCTRWCKVSSLDAEGKNKGSSSVRFAVIRQRRVISARPFFLGYVCNNQVASRVSQVIFYQNTYVHTRKKTSRAAEICFALCTQRPSLRARYKILFRSKALSTASNPNPISTRFQIFQLYNFQHW